MSHHSKSQADGFELLALQFQRFRTAPKPGLMNERNVGRIDEPDDGIIDIGWEPNRLDVMQPLVRRNQQIGKNILRNLGLMLVTWHVDPNRAAYFFAGIGVGLDFPDIEGAIRQGGDLLAGAGAVELPTVIATFDGSSVELALRERHSSMWTVVPQRERISASISAQDDPFAEQFFGLKSALFQFFARECEVPEVSQKQGVLHITELRSCPLMLRTSSSSGVPFSYATAFITKDRKIKAAAKSIVLQQFLKLFCKG